MKTLVSVVTPSYVVELGRLLTEPAELEGDWTGRFTNSHDANLRACGILKMTLTDGATFLNVEAISKVEIETAPESNQFVPYTPETVPSAPDVKEDEEPVVIETSEGAPVEVVAEPVVEAVAETVVEVAPKKKK